MAIFAYKNTNWELPEEVEEYLLCQMFHCTPDVLDTLDYARVKRHWFVHNKIKEAESTAQTWKK